MNRWAWAAFVLVLGCRKDNPADRNGESDKPAAKEPAATKDAAPPAEPSDEDAPDEDDPGPDPSQPEPAEPPTPGGSVAGVAWGDPPEASKLPTDAVSANSGGEAKPIVRAVAGRLPGMDDSPLFLDLFLAEPAAPCALHIGQGASTAGFNFALGTAVKAGDTPTYKGKSELDAKPPVYARYTETSGPGRIRVHGDGDAVIVVDSVGAKRIRGRVYAAFRDAGKSMVVGKFDAPICADSDVR